MANIKTVGLAFAAALMLSAVTVASASGAEFVPASGTITGKNTTTALGKEPTLTAGSNVIACGGETDSATISGAMEITKINMTFTNCKEGSIPCESGTTTGTIGFKEQKTFLGLGMKTIAESPGTIGLLFSPEVGAMISEFKCSIITVKLEGRAFCTITPIKVITTKFIVTCKASGSSPEYKFYLLKSGEGLEEVKLMAFGVEAALMLEDELTVSKEIEIKP